jgi:acyl carrier protein
MDNTMNSQNTPAEGARVTEEEISDWMRARIAEQLQMPAEEVDVELPFSSYGLDSVSAIGFSAELEDWLKVPLAPTLTWDYPTIALLARFLATC